jgi:integrase
LVPSIVSTISVTVTGCTAAGAVQGVPVGHEQVQAPPHQCAIIAVPTFYIANPMASLQRRPNGVYYIAYRKSVYDDRADGAVTRQTWVSLRTKDLREARTAFREFQNSGKTLPRKVNDVRFIDLMKWVRELKALDAKSYEKTYKYACARLEDEFGNNYLSNINRERLVHWEAKMKAEGLGRSSIHKYMTMLKHVFRLAIDHDRFDGKNPFTAYKVPMENKPRGVILTPAQQTAILRACYDPKRPPRNRQTHSQAISPQTLREIVEVALWYGLRLGEIIGVNQRTVSDGIVTFVKTGGLRVGNLDPSTNVLRFLRTKAKERSRGVKSTTIRVSRHVSAILQRNSQGKKPGDLVFTNRREPIFSIQKAFNDAVEAARLRLFDDEGTPVAKLRFSDLRPTAASNMLSFGLSETQISKILGHVDTRMASYVYLRKIQDETMSKAAEKIERGLKARQSA